MSEGNIQNIYIWDIRQEHVGLKGNIKRMDNENAKRIMDINFQDGEDKLERKIEIKVVGREGLAETGVEPGYLTPITSRPTEGDQDSSNLGRGLSAAIGLKVRGDL